jgi:outer membrane protein OmpU
MNKLTKIGVSALAGSLAAVSVNAAELTVAGSATLSYLSTDQENVETGNRFGSNSTMSFKASGDVNGYTVSLHNAISDTAGVSSHFLSIDMGDMGTLTFDQGVGGNGFASIDDMSPTAWEESWDQSATAGHTIAGNQSTNTFKYTNTIMGIAINAAYDPATGDADQGDGGAGAAGVTGSSHGIALSNSTLIDGLAIGAGFGADDNNASTTLVKDLESIGAYANYTFGPMTAGYTFTETTGGASGHGANIVNAYGVVFAVNENLSISYNEHSNTYAKSGGDAEVDQDSTGMAIAYTMGSASIKIQNNETKNDGGVTTAKTKENTEISLSLAF